MTAGRAGGSGVGGLAGAAGVQQLALLEDADLYLSMTAPDWSDR
jgi:hypothetical protein